MILYVLFLILVFRDTSGLLLLLGLDFFAMILPIVHIQILIMGMLTRVGKPIRAKALSGVRRLCLYCLLLLVRPLVRLLCSFLYFFLCSKVLGSGTLEPLSAFQLAFYGDSLESSGGLIIYKAPSPGWGPYIWSNQDRPNPYASLAWDRARLALLGLDRLMRPTEPYIAQRALPRQWGRLCKLKQRPRPDPRSSPS